jgi:hypothetical protein
MAVTAKQVYDAALVLMDEVTETGNIITDQPEYYKAKALQILTTLQTELLPLSVAPVPIIDINQNLLVSDRTALLVLPYGLAAHLLLADDMNLASFLNARFDELKRKLQTGGIQPIKDVYWGGEDNGTTS